MHILLSTRRRTAFQIFLHQNYTGCDDSNFPGRHELDRRQTRGCLEQRSTTVTGLDGPSSSVPSCSLVRWRRFCTTSILGEPFKVSARMDQVMLRTAKESFDRCHAGSPRLPREDQDAKTISPAHLRESRFDLRWDLSVLVGVSGCSLAASSLTFSFRIGCGGCGEGKVHRSCYFRESLVCIRCYLLLYSLHVSMYMCSC